MGLLSSLFGGEKSEKNKPNNKKKEFRNSEIRRHTRT